MQRLFHRQLNLVRNCGVLILTDEHILKWWSIHVFLGHGLKITTICIAWMENNHRGWVGRGR
jgi:hypothetical protein